MTLRFFNWPKLCTANNCCFLIALFWHDQKHRRHEIISTFIFFSFKNTHFSYPVFICDEVAMVMLFNCDTKRKRCDIFGEWPRNSRNCGATCSMFVYCFFFLMPQNILAFAYRSAFSQKTVSRARPLAICENNANAKFERKRFTYAPKFRVRIRKNVECSFHFIMFFPVELQNGITAIECTRLWECSLFTLAALNRISR